MDRNVMDRVMGCVSCPVCFLVPEKEVYQCRYGHILCDKCNTQMVNCWRCGVSTVCGYRSRNLLIEETLDTMRFNCPFSDTGCIEKVKRSQMTAHRSHCKFGKRVQLCKFLDTLHCDFNLNICNINKMADHLVLEHGHRIVSGKNRTILGLNLIHFFVPFDMVYCHILKFDEPHHTYTILFVTKQRGSHVSWILLGLDDETHTKDIHVKLWSDQTPTVAWTIPVLPVMDAKYHFENPMINVFIPSLHSFRKQNLAHPPNNIKEGTDNNLNYIVSFKLLF